MPNEPTPLPDAALAALRTDPFILAFGDSLTAGYGLARDDALPARLQALLRTSLSGAIVRNAGVSGDTTRTALGRLPRLLSSLDRRPDLAIVELGANDLIQRIDPTETCENLHAILREFDRCDVSILIASVQPPAMLGDLAKAYSGISKEVAAAHGTPVHPFFPPGVLGHHAHVLRDRFHPNALAIGKVAAAMAPVVLAILEGREPKPSDANDIPSF